MNDIIVTIIEHQMESEIMKYRNFDIDYLIKNGLFNKILKSFSYDTINYIIDNTNNIDYTKLIFILCKFCNHITIIKKVIDMVDINIVDNKNWSILHYCCNRINKSYNLIKYIIDKGVDINIKTNKGLIALDMLYKYSIVPVDITILHLFETLYDPIVFTNNGKYLLNLCKSKNNGDTLEYILDKYKIIPELYTIFKFHNFSTIKNIVEKYNISFKDKPFGNLICERFNYDLTIITYFVDKGLSLNMANKKGQTTLAIICKHSNNYDVIKYMIDYFIKNKLDINKCDKFNYNPMYYLCYGSDNIEKYKGLLYLIKSGCDTTILLKKLDLINTIKKLKLKSHHEATLVSLIESKREEVYCKYYIIVIVFIFSILGLLLVI